jgi:hypothetical protein
MNVKYLQKAGKQNFDIDILLKRRLIDVVKHRQSIFYILNKYYGYSKSNLARLFDFTHSTVISSIKVVENELTIASRVENIEFWGDVISSLQDDKTATNLIKKLDAYVSTSIFNKSEKAEWFRLRESVIIQPELQVRIKNTSRLIPFSQIADLKQDLEVEILDGGELVDEGLVSDFNN